MGLCLETQRQWVTGSARGPPLTLSTAHLPVTGAVYALAVTVETARVPPHVGVMWLRLEWLI